DRSFKGQAECANGPPVFVTEKRVLGAQLDFGKTAMRVKIPRRFVDFLPRPTELRDDEGEPFGDCGAGLEAEVFDVASMVRGVLSRGLLPKEDRPQFRQRARIFEPERVGHWRNKTVKAVIALQTCAAGATLIGAEPAAVQPRRIAHYRCMESRWVGNGCGN